MRQRGAYLVCVIAALACGGRDSRRTIPEPAPSPAPSPTPTPTPTPAPTAPAAPPFEVQWGAPLHFAHVIAATPDGGVVVSNGGFSHVGDHGGVSDTRVRLTRLAADGTRTSAHDYSPEEVPRFGGIAVATDGGVYATGLRTLADGTRQNVVSRQRPEGGADVVCTGCGGGRQMGAGPDDQLVSVHSDPTDTGYAYTVQVVDGRTGRVSDVVTTKDFAWATFAPDGDVVVACEVWEDAPGYMVRKYSVRGVERWRLAIPPTSSFGLYFLSNVVVLADGTTVGLARLWGTTQWGSAHIQTTAYPENWLLAIDAQGRAAWGVAAPEYLRDLSPLFAAAGGDRVYVATTSSCTDVWVAGWASDGTPVGESRLPMSGCAPYWILTVSATKDAVFVAGPLAGSLDLGGREVSASATENAFVVKLVPRAPR